MEDLINRQTIIDRLEFVIKHGIETDGAHSISTEKMLEFVRELPIAEVGTDCISREAVLNEFCHSCDGWSCNPNTCCKTEWIRKLPVIQPEIVRCKDCKHFEYDHVENINGIPLIVAHEICTRWGDGVKTSENGYYFLAERKEVTT